MPRRHTKKCSDPNPHSFLAYDRNNGFTIVEAINLKEAISDNPHIMILDDVNDIDPTIMSLI